MKKCLYSTTKAGTIPVVTKSFKKWVPEKVKTARL